ncbi:MAG: segregation/condensation protein A [Gammaproteobacteria bacterium]|nr:segregation/condensation protein A [Gammaproteobacteria bacterium]
MTESDNNQEQSNASTVITRQTEMPFAVVQGEEVTELPQDLYIPPEALRVFLTAFEGPLDLLLYLIKRQNIDILDIPIADITKQYTQYIELMHDMELELAGEYLLMAAMLAEIKSRMLLPRPAGLEEDEDDPRAELVRRLLEYERFKKAAEELSELPRLERDVHLVTPEVKATPLPEKLPDIKLKELVISFQEVLRRAEMFAHHHIQREQLSVRERMSQVLTTLSDKRFCEFTQLFSPREGRMGAVVTFLALLELIKDGLVELVQSEAFAPIHLKVAKGSRAKRTSANDDQTADDEQSSERPNLRVVHGSSEASKTTKNDNKPS